MEIPLHKELMAGVRFPSIENATGFDHEAHLSVASGSAGAGSRHPIRLALALGGIDRGRSGIGRYARAVLPRLIAEVTRDGGSLVAMGTRRDFEDCAEQLEGAERLAIPDVCDAPGASAIWHLARSATRAARAGASVLLLPAGNRRAALGAGVPTVAVVHDLAPLRVPGKYDALRTFYLRRMLTAALRRTTELVADSNATRDDLLLAGCSAERVRVVHCGVDTTRFRRAASSEALVRAARLGHGLARPYLLYPARLEHPGKNHVRLLNAFALSTLRKEHDLVLAGADWGAEKRIRQEIARLGLTTRVRLLGYVPDDSLAGLLAGAEAVLVVGLYEGFGLPALEALASGRPVVVARTGASLESVGRLGVPCDPYDEISMRAAMERAVADVRVRERAGLEGPAWAAAWSWDRTARGLVDACLAAARR